MELIAHRGAAFDAPENSLEAFESAIAQGAARIELDLHITRDGAPVVHHDLTTSRCGDRNVEIASVDLDVVRQVRLRNGEPVPTFVDACKVVAGRVALDVEIKARSPLLAELVVSQLAEHGLLDDALITSFHEEVLAAARACGYRGRLGLLIGSRSLQPTQRAYEAWPLAAIRRSGADALAIHHQLLHPLLRAAIRKNRWGLYLWASIEDERRTQEGRAQLYTRMRAQAPDGIIVGRVREALNVLSSLSAEEGQ